MIAEKWLVPPIKDQSYGRIEEMVKYYLAGAFLIFNLVNIEAQVLRISTDRSFYYPGDYILIEGWSTFQMLDKIAENVYIIDQNENIIATFPLLIQNGFGTVLYPINHEIEHGYYQVSFNQTPNNWISKIIYIGNSPPAVNEKNKIKKSIIPEGHQVTCGCPTLFSLYADPRDTITIYDQGLNFIDSLETDESGFASFYYRPSYGTDRLTFYLNAKNDTTTITIDKLNKSGYCISTVLNDQQGFLEIKIAPNDSLHNFRQLHLTFKNGTSDFNAYPDFEKQNYAQIRVPFSNLTSGIGYLEVREAQDNEVLDNDYLYRRTMYIPHQEQPLSMSISSERIAPRNKISISLKKSLPGNVVGSLKIVSADFLSQNEVNYNLGATTMLPTNILNEFPSLGNYFLNGHFNSLNRALIFYKDDVKIKQPIPPSQIPIVKLKLDPAPKDSVLITLYNPKKNILIETNVSSQVFNYRLYFDSQEDSKFYYHTFSNNQLVSTSLRIEYDAISFTGEKPLFSITRPSENFEKLAQIHLHYPKKLAMQARENPDEVSLPMDFERDLTKYFKFETMEEAVTETMPGLAIRSRNGKRVFRVFSEEQRAFHEGEPLFIVNGIPTFNQEKIFSLDPKKFIFFGLAHSNSTLINYGHLGVSGAVVLKTTERLSNFNNNHITLPARQPFYTPNVSFKANETKIHQPEFNPLVYYQANIPLNGSQSTHETKDITFTHNDATGEFYIIYEGIYSDQYPILLMERYNSEVSK